MYAKMLLGVGYAQLLAAVLGQEGSAAGHRRRGGESAVQVTVVLAVEVIHPLKHRLAQGIQAVTAGQDGGDDEQRAGGVAWRGVA